MMSINSRNILWSENNIILLNLCRNSADGTYNKYLTHNMALKYIITNLEERHLFGKCGRCNLD
jgi:hypothetical protein